MAFLTLEQRISNVDRQPPTGNLFTVSSFGSMIQKECDRSDAHDLLCAGLKSQAVFFRRLSLDGVTLQIVKVKTPQRTVFSCSLNGVENYSHGNYFSVATRAIWFLEREKSRLEYLATQKIKLLASLASESNSRFSAMPLDIVQFVVAPFVVSRF